MLWRLGLSVCLIAIASAPAFAQSCARTDFEAVVDNAAEALRQLNGENKPVFQERLRALREKRGWDHDTFISKAQPFVIDETIEGFDSRSQDLLNTIASLGEQGTSAETPDCSLLLRLRELMTDLVAAQKEKWAYMFAKLDKAIAGG